MAFVITSFSLPVILRMLNIYKMDSLPFIFTSQLLPDFFGPHFQEPSQLRSQTFMVTFYVIKHMNHVGFMTN